MVSGPADRQRAGKVKSLGLKALKSKPLKRAPEGRRIYAVGDVHGRVDLLDRLLAAIVRDAADFDGAPTLVFLGDYVDRGLQGRAVLDRLVALQENPAFETRFLKGNHEAALLEFLKKPSGGAAWLTFGGAETLYSYGVQAPSAVPSPEELRRASQALNMALPRPHLAFLKELELVARFGDYVFVHAGLRPGKTFEEQVEDDMLNIRESFLNSRRKWPFVVVHGHTPEDGVHIDQRRIGVDTGAYATGKLSAVRLEGAEVSVIST